jgi:hypothetical protein
VRTTIDSIADLKLEHERTWRDRPDWYWCLGLLEEVVELILSLIGLHRHKPDYELRQISSIAANWIDKRADDMQNAQVNTRAHQ